MKEKFWGKARPRSPCAQNTWCAALSFWGSIRRPLRADFCGSSSPIFSSAGKSPLRVDGGSTSRWLCGASSSHCYRRLYGVAAEHSSRRPSICSRAFSFFSAGRSGSAARRSSLSAAAETTSGTGNEKIPFLFPFPLRSHRLCRPRHAGFFQIASPRPGSLASACFCSFCSNAASGRPRRSRIDAASGCSCFPVHVAFVCAHSLVVACPGSPAATLTCSCSRPCAAARACCSWFSLFSLCIEARATACTSSALSRAFSCRVKQADFAAAKSARPRSSQTRHPGYCRRLHSALWQRALPWQLGKMLHSSSENSSQSSASLRYAGDSTENPSCPPYSNRKTPGTCRER